MSWIKKKVDNYLLKVLGDKAIFNQEETFEIKKRNEYYEKRDERLNKLSTPAPVVGDISSMTDIAPAVRLPRIPYYEYIYFLMRWNSSVLRMIAMKIKQEVFRESRLHGLDWEGKFKVKCDECGTEFDEQLEQCEFCNSKNVSPPDPTQKKLLEPFLKEANKAEQTLFEVFEEEEDDLNTVDDAYLVFVKDYFVGPGGLFGKVTEIMRGDPSRFRIVSDISGRRGGKWWICPAHRNSAVKPDEYNDNPLCAICRLPLQDVHYVETTTGGVTPAKYYIKGEVVHSSKYEPSRLYGIPAMFSVYIIARTIQLMDLYTEELYEKGRIKGIFGVPTDNVTELKKWWDEVIDRLRTDPHYIPIVGINSGPDGSRARMEFVKLIDNMDELKFQEHRRMLKEEIAGLFGVNLVFLADTSASGGLNNEGLQITVTDRTVEWGQSIYHDQYFPKILESLSITDWIIKLKPSKETDEMAELERFDLRVETAGKLQNMGYDLDLKDDKFEVRGKAYKVDGPINTFGGGFGNTADSSSSSADVQEGKPDKPKPEKEIKRSMEKEGARAAAIIREISDMEREKEKFINQLSVLDEGSAKYKNIERKVEKLYLKINNYLRDKLPKARKLDESLGKAIEKGDEKYYISECNNCGKRYANAHHLGGRITKCPYCGSFDTDLYASGQSEAAVSRYKVITKSLEKAQCRGRIPKVKGFHPYYCPSEKVNFQFFVDSEGQAWYIGAEDDQGKDISRWVTLGNVKTAFGWYGQEVKDGRGKIMKSDDDLLLARMSSKFIEEVNHIALGGLFRDDWNRLSTEGKHGIKRKLWSNHGESWFNMSFNSKKTLVQREINSILRKSMPSDLAGLKDRFNRCLSIANPTEQQKQFCQSIVNNLKSKIGKRQQQLIGSAGSIDKLNPAQKREYNELNDLWNKIKRVGMFKSDEIDKQGAPQSNRLKQAIKDYQEKRKKEFSLENKIDQKLRRAGWSRTQEHQRLKERLKKLRAARQEAEKRMFAIEEEDKKKSDDEFLGQDISDELKAEIEAHLEQAFNNPGNFVYVDIPDTTKDYQFIPQIQAFDLERVNDESGQSGTGIVLSGIIFHDGKVVVRWNTETASTTVFDSWEDFESIHISQHPGNETKVHYYQLNEGDTKDFAKAVVERGKDVIDDYKQIEHNFAKQLEEIYFKKLGKKIEKLDDKSANRLIKEIDSIVQEATPLIEKLAFSEVLRAYKKGKKIDESREVSKTIDLPDNLTEPFRAEYGAFGLDKDDWQVLRAIYRKNPFWKAFEGMSQSVSDKLKEHITESYEAPNSARMKATIRDVKREYPNISKERAEIIAYGRIGKFSLAKVLGMMKRTINAETYRLERIARTETTAITSKGREMQFKQTDPESLHKYDWFGPNDARNSEECPEIKRRIAKEGKGRGVSIERVKEIQEEVVEEKNQMRKSKWIYRDWTPHANCRHGLRRIV